MPGQPVEFGVLARPGHGLIGNLDGLGALGVTDCRRQRKPAVVGETIEHAFARAVARDLGVVVALVEKETRLLVLEQVDLDGELVELHADDRIGLADEHALRFLQPFQLAAGNVAPFDDGLRLNDLAEDLDDLLLALIDAERERLQDDVVAVLVDDESGHLVALRGHQPKRFRIGNGRVFASVFQRRLDAAGEE